MEERIIVDGNLYHPAAEHGTKNGYQNFCCRCPECKAAWSRSMNEYLRRRKIRNQGLGGAQ